MILLANPSEQAAPGMRRKEGVRTWGERSSRSFLPLQPLLSGREKPTRWSKNN
jgi:hypothetical protein